MMPLKLLKNTGITNGSYPNKLKKEIDIYEKIRKYM